MFMTISTFSGVDLCSDSQRRALPTCQLSVLIIPPLSLTLLTLLNFSYPSLDSFPKAESSMHSYVYIYNKKLKNDVYSSRDMVSIFTTTHVSFTQLPSSIWPSLLGPSFAQLSTAPLLGSSSL